MTPAKAEKCAHPICTCLTSLGQVLQHRVRGHGKDAGHRLFVRTHGLQGQNVLRGNNFSSR